MHTIAPEVEDLLVIEDIPDIFHVGHVHKAQLDMYKGILLVNSGSWQTQTPFQASVGMVPNPGLAIIINLKTFQAFVRIIVQTQIISCKVNSSLNDFFIISDGTVNLYFFVLP